MRILSIILGLLLAVASEAQADNPELASLAEQDQADRAQEENGWDDDARRRRTLELLASGGIVTPRDKLNAALILQHTPGTLCAGKLKSTSPENYLLAHLLAKEALAAGLDDAKYMVAQSIDRFLSFTQGRQLYGTSQLVDLETGEAYLPQIDRSITDAERAAHGVPPLSTLLKQAPERPAPASEG